MTTTPMICPRHGSYQEGPYDRFACPTCKTEGNAIEKAWRASWVVWRAWQASGVPTRFRNRRFSNFRTPTKMHAAALKAAQAVAAGDMQGLALLGPVGVGKSHLGIAIAADAIRAGYVARWWNVAELLRAWRSTFERGSEIREETFLERLAAADVLILDEIGVRATDWESAALTELVDIRYRDETAIVLTGNSTDIAQAIGERAADRLREMGAVLALAGASYRKQAADDLDLAIEDDFTAPPERIQWPVCDCGRDRIEIRTETNHTGPASHRPLTS